MGVLLCPYLRIRAFFCPETADREHVFHLIFRYSRIVALIFKAIRKVRRPFPAIDSSELHFLESSARDVFCVADKLR